MRENHTPPVSCPVCGVAAASPVIEYPDHPAVQFPLPAREAREVARASLVLWLCQDCGHLFQHDVNERLLNRVYGEYYRYYPFDGNEAMAGPYREPFNRMATKVLTGRSGRLLEIGCSRPENLKPFADMHFSCVGVDPSPLAAKSTDDSRVRIIQGYYQDMPFDGPWDVIVSRFNLEHIADLMGFMNRLDQDLDDHGVALVQVPNLEFQLRQYQPLFAAHEHIHYFSLGSLHKLFARFGYRPLMAEGGEGPSLISAYTKEKRSEPSPRTVIPGLLEGWRSMLDGLARDLANSLAGVHRAVLYGCGLSMFWLAPLLEQAGVRVIQVVDDNPLAQNKCVPLLGWPINPPVKEVFRDVDAVVLSLSPLYHAAVCGRLAGFDVRVPVLALGRGRVETIRF